MQGKERQVNNTQVTITYADGVQETSVFERKGEAEAYVNRLRTFWATAIERRQVAIGTSSTEAAPGIMRERVDCIKISRRLREEVCED